MSTHSSDLNGDDDEENKNDVEMEDESNPKDKREIMNVPSISADLSTPTKVDKNTDSNNEEEKFLTPIGTDPFKKSNRIARSPGKVDVQGQRSHSKKRKLNISDSDDVIPSSVVSGFVDTKVKGMISSINILKTLIIEHSNTKRVIKTEVEKLGGIMKALTEESLMEYFKREGMKPKVITQGEKPTHRCQGTQTQEVVSIPEELDFEEFEDLEKRIWTKENFECTDLKVVTPKELESSKNLLLILGQKDLEKPLVKNVVERKSQSTDTLSQVQLIQGKPIMFKSRYSVITSNDIDPVEGESSLCLLHMNYEDATKDTVSRESLFNSLKQTCQLLAGNGNFRNETLMVAAFCNIEITLLRKLLECIFRHTNIKVLVLGKANTSFADMMKKKDETQKKNTQTKKFTAKKKENGVINIIMKEDKKQEYDEVIKQMKNEINLEELGIQVKGIVKTKKGNARIITEEKSSASLGNLQKKINALLGDRGKAVGDADKNMALMKDIDTTTTKEEVEQAIRISLNLDPDSAEIKVVNMKINQRGNTQSATIETSRNEFLKLMDIGKVRIGGWQTCRVEEFVVPTRCFKCNLYGHRGFECKNEEFNRDCCFNCNQQGHKAAECTKEAFCQACNKSGHKSGSMMCEVYKKLVLEERKKRNRKNYGSMKASISSMKSSVEVEKEEITTQTSND